MTDNDPAEGSSEPSAGEPIDDRPVVSLAAIPVQSWDVRRRRYGDGRWLMRHNEVFEIDELTDAVWRACTDRLGIGAITRVVADELALAPGHALEVTVGALQLLGDAGLVRFEPGG